MSILDFATATGKERKEVISKAREASELLKAMSHEGRLLILCLLTAGERSVSEIEKFMDLPQAAVSQQLARLRLDGVVNARRDGRSIYYSLASKEVSKVISTLHNLLCKPGRGVGSRKQ